MPVLTFDEYDGYYFDGANHSLSHNAGYTQYKRWHRHDPGRFPEDTGEFFGDVAAALRGRFNANQSVLELGCAKGYLVQDLRAVGVDAWGVDVSQYAYDQADPTVQPYLTVSDAYSYLLTLKRNQFNTIFSRWFLCCISNADMPALVTQMNRVARNQVHIVAMVLPPEYYTIHTPQEWLDLFPWATGTYIVPEHDFTAYLRK